MHVRKRKVSLSCGQQSLREFDIVGSFEVRQSLDRAWNVKDLEADMCRSKHLELIRKDLKEEEIGFLGNCFQNPNIRGILLFEIKEPLH